MEPRIIDIEKKIAFLDHTIEELNNVVCAHQKCIQDLQEQLGVLAEKLDSGDFVKKIGEEEPPPHY